MARPVKRRRICEMPCVEEFCPSAARSADSVEMTVDEYEAIRLIDGLDFSQEECALQMNVARTTVQAIYDSARKKLAEVLVQGKRLKIGGGAYELCPRAQQCCGKNCHGGSTGTHCANGGLSCRHCSRIIKGQTE